MLITSIIATLGLKVIFFEAPKMPNCGNYNSDTKIVLINLASWCDQNFVMYHELGHALFLQDKEVKAIVAKYPDPRFYYSTEYPTADEKLNEKVADYFAKYRTEKDFSVKFPKLKELFDSKLATLK